MLYKEDFQLSFMWVIISEDQQYSIVDFIEPDIYNGIGVYVCRYENLRKGVNLF